MPLSDLHFSRYVNCFYAWNPEGSNKKFVNRRFSCFILTFSGTLCFTADGVGYIADAEHALFLPQGLSYTCEPLSDAESIVINFTVADPPQTPIPLHAVTAETAKQYFQRFQLLSASLSPQKSMLQQKELSTLAAILQSGKSKSSAADRLTSAAIEYMMENYHVPSLTVKSIADHCFISEIYLRKLFTAKFDSTPMHILRDIRMQKAYILAKEKRPVKEIAASVGYSAVYQFSRAYKKYYGISPSKA